MDLLYGYRISSVSGYGKYPNMVRLYLDNVLVFELVMPARQPLSYLREWKTGKYRKQFIAQCEAHEVPQCIINDVLKGK